MSNLICLTTMNADKTKDFYSKLMPMIGQKIIFKNHSMTKIDNSTVIFLSDNPNITQDDKCIKFKMHSMQEVISFYIISVGLGAKNKEVPTLTDNYHSAWYHTRVTDPDGNNLEAVCQLD